MHRVCMSTLHIHYCEICVLKWAAMNYYFVVFGCLSQVPTASSECFFCPVSCPKPQKYPEKTSKSSYLRSWNKRFGHLNCWSTSCLLTNRLNCSSTSALHNTFSCHSPAVSLILALCLKLSWLACWQAATMCLIESSSTVIKTPFVALHINLFSLKAMRGRGRLLKWCDAPWRACLNH